MVDRDRSGLYGENTGTRGRYSPGRTGAGTPFLPKNYGGNAATAQNLLSKQFEEYLQTMGITEPTRQDVLAFEKALLGDELYGPESGVLKAGIYDIDNRTPSGFRGADSITEYSYTTEQTPVIVNTFDPRYPSYMRNLDTLRSDAVAKEYALDQAIDDYVGQAKGVSYYSPNRIPAASYVSHLAAVNNPGYRGVTFGELDFKQRGHMPESYLDRELNALHAGSSFYDAVRSDDDLMHGTSLYRPESEILADAKNKFKTAFGREIDDAGIMEIRNLFKKRSSPVMPTYGEIDAVFAKYLAKTLSQMVTTKHENVTPLTELGERLGTEFVVLDEFSPNDVNTRVGYNPYAQAPLTKYEYPHMNFGHLGGQTHAESGAFFPGERGLMPIDPTNLQPAMLSGVYQEKYKDPANLRNFLLTGQTEFSEPTTRTFDTTRLDRKEYGLDRYDYYALTPEERERQERAYRGKLSGGIFGKKETV